ASVRRALALSSVLMFALPAVAEQPAALVVVLDPGHGGRWPHDGAHGRRGLHEKVIALQVAQKTKELLEQQGATVILTRDTNDAVAGILNDLALGQARNDSAALAQIVQQHMLRGTRSPSRGVRQAPFLVLSGTRMPSALVEIGFISHPREGRMLAGDKYQHTV